ncbi:MAG: pyruvate,orthophosphate dikinase [Gammaproteobacteria bacterium]
MSHSFGQWILAIDGSALPERELVGGKAWSIARMRELGLNVPPAIVITTAACAAYLESGSLPDGLVDELASAIKWLEQQSNRTFGGGRSPLLVSVRSGAAISMPGMMDTVLNLGINDETEQALAEESGSAEFAHDTHRRFLDLYASIVLKATLNDLEPEKGAAQWREEIAAAAGQDVPLSSQSQLHDAILAVFDSCNSRRARRYRKHHNLPDNLGTAVTVQAMVFGNLDDQSGTGVLFSRNPLTGDSAPYGEYLHRAQGEDVVSGKFTPLPLSALQTSAPHIYDELLRAADTLERESTDVQDIEFTVQRGELYLLQSRAAKRAPEASVRFAVDFVAEGLVDEKTALLRVSPEQIRSLLQPRLASGVTDTAELLAHGEPACQGIGIGAVVTNADEAERRAANDEAVVLARSTTSPEDVHGMIASRAVITDHGGSTSHAAVVSRALGVPCVVGCGEGSAAALDGKVVTIDGTSGNIYAGALAVVTPNELDQNELTLLTEWARAISDVTVFGPDDPSIPSGCLDLNKIDGGEDPAQLANLIGEAKSVMGRVLDTDAGVEAALNAGVECIISRHILPSLLSAVHRKDSKTYEK